MSRHFTIFDANLFMSKRVFFWGFLTVLLFSVFSCGNKKQKNDETDFQVTGEEVEIHNTPEQKGVVTDYEELFSKSESEALTQKCNSFSDKNAIPVAVMTNPSFGDYKSFTEFADAVSNKWQICNNDEGILFVISNNLGEIRMISCPKTETRISDEDFDYVINQVVFDAFRQSKFADGIMNAIDYLDQKIKR